jgi:membrane fusion protein (multidrug efflux system)
VNADPKIHPIGPRQGEAVAPEVPRRRMSFLRQFVLVLVLIGIAGLGYAAYRQYGPAGTGADPAGAGANNAAIPVVLGVAELRETARRVEAVGTTLSRRAVQIVSLTSGRVEEVTFEPGEQVDAGEILVRLDDDIEQADLKEAEAVLEENALALQRAQALRQKNAVPEATVEQLVAAQASAQADLDRARRRLADRTVRAPFSGMVGLRQVDPGARVDEDTVLTTLDDRSEMEIEFSLPETLYGQVTIGQAVTATSAAFPDRAFEGLVATIDSRIDATSRAFKVRALLPNPDLALPAGMFMHVSVVLESRMAVMVPEEAVIVQGDRTYVFVVDGDRATARDVVLGLREPGAVEVVSGLADGEAVVVRGTPRLRDGAPVRVMGGDAASVGAAAPGPGAAEPT